MLGTLLTWMAERNTRVFLVATANDIARLPPELIRKGRIDELFFVDLPVMAEQIEDLRDWARERCVPAHGPGRNRSSQDSLLQPAVVRNTGQRQVARV